MDRSHVLSQLQAQIARSDGDSATRLKGYVRHLGEDWALVTGTTLTAENLEQAILTEIDYFRNLHREFEWKVSSWDDPPNLRESLRRHGFLEGDEEAIMVFDLNEDWESWVQGSPQETVKVVTDEHLEDYKKVEGELGADRSYLPEVIDSLRRGDNVSMAFVGYFERRPVSIARLTCDPGSPFGGCYGGSTLAEFRRMGFYRSLMLARAIEARRLGLRYLQVDSLPTSRPILERLGFERLGSTWPYTWKPEATSGIAKIAIS